MHAVVFDCRPGAQARCRRSARRRGVTVSFRVRVARATLKGSGFVVHNFEARRRDADVWDDFTVRVQSVMDIAERAPAAWAVVFWFHDGGSSTAYCSDAKAGYPHHGLPGFAEKALTAAIAAG